jgi:hypothetical protein
MKRHWLIGILAILMSLLAACTNETSSIGIGLIDPLGTDFTDTVTVSAYSFLEDTINTTNTSANLVGDIHDPIFGNVTASTYAQFSLSGSAVNFGASPVIDSVVLTLQLASYYGDTSSAVGIRVYQLSEPLDANTNYYNNSTVAHDATPLNYSLTGYSIQPSTHVIVDTGDYSPHLRIRLSQEFGQYLLNNQDQMTSNSTFKNFFKGLCITAENHTGSNGYILLTNMTSSLTGIILYYHNENSGTTKYTFSCASDCRRFTNYNHDYNASSDQSFIQEVLQGDRTIGNTKLFVQATGGVKTHISFPYLKDAFKSIGNRVVINRAELVITDIDPHEIYLVHPANLTLQGILANGSFTYLPDDEYYTSSSYFGGTYDATRHEYRFRITRYVQELVQGTGSLTESVNLVVRGASVRANRLVFGGTGLDNDQRLRLELSYTTY